MNTLRRCLGLPSYVWGAVSFGALVVWSRFEELHPLLLTALPLFLITVVELARSRRLQAAAHLRTHMAEFPADKYLRGSFYDLIYSYADADWEDVQNRVNRPRSALSTRRMG